VDANRLRNSGLDEDELKYIGPYLVVAQAGPDGEMRGFCIECEDPKTSKTPSASYNFRGSVKYGKMSDVWHCMKGHGGSIMKSVAALIREDNKTSNVIDIKTRKEVPAKPLPSQGDIDEFTKALFASPRLLDQLASQRMLTPETLSKFHIGWSSHLKRFTIPVYDASGKLINVRCYMINAKGESRKMIPIQNGYHTQLYNASALNGRDEIVMTEGETDCMLLEQEGIPAVTHTGGAGSFQMEWAAAFTGKHVFLCFDEDETGRKSMIKTARMIAPVAKAVYIVTGLDTGKAGGDITDYFLNGNTAKQFRALMDSVRGKPFSIDAAEHMVPTQGKKVSLVNSQDAAISGPIEFIAMVSGKRTPPYLAPRVIEANCSQDKGKVCAVCPMAAFNGERVMSVPSDDPTLLGFIDLNERGSLLRTAKMVGARCSDKIEMHVRDTWNIEQLQVDQSISDRTEEVMTPMSRPVYSIGTHATGCNMDYRIVGKQEADPRNSRGVIQAWQIEKVAADFEKFKVNAAVIEELSVFNPGPLQSPLDKCKEIAEDLAANVTNIYGRDMVHVAFDLVWHSALNFVFQGKPIGKGWLECLAMGDTRTGKSKVCDNLIKHYRAGKSQTCEGMTFAGLVGGLNQTSDGYMTNWGVMANNDRRALFMDEMSGLMFPDGKTKGIIEQMSSIRSSGIAEITKIKKDTTSARTRLFWASNPVDGRTLAETAGGGMDAIRKMIGTPEDIARFDFAIAVSSADVPSDLINAINRPKVEHIHTASACSKLVMWAWSRKVDQVRFMNDSEDLIVKESRIAGKRYVNDPPLVQPENIREKIARLAVAFAARTFSTDPTGELILVEPEHVESAVEFLDWIYGHEAMGYLRHSTRTKANQAEAAKNARSVKRFLKQETNHGILTALNSVMGAESFRPRDFEEFGGVDVTTTMDLMLKWKMIRRLTTTGGRVALEPTMVHILKALEDE
jgi:hypothetical protein